MAPPAKRRRRDAPAAPQDEDEQPRANTLSNFLVASPGSPSKNRPTTSSPSPLKHKASNGQSFLSTPTRQARKSSNGKNGTSPSPRKLKDGTQVDHKGRTADLKTLFSKQAQLPARSTNGKEKDLADDIISDPISEDDEISDVKASLSSLVGQHARKRIRAGHSEVTNETPSGSQMFRRPSKTAGDGQDDDLRPWTERFGPKNLDELVVHKKKVADVRRWLDEVMSGRLRQRVLILKGAAGSGKTTTLKLLARDMGCSLLEWKNPTGNSGTGFVSASAQFDDFIGRGGRFGALDMEEPLPSSTPATNGAHARPDDNAKRIILVEEFPNTFSRSSSALSSFRSSLTSYLATHMPPPARLGLPQPREPIKPIILVISETLLTTTSASADSFTAHRLLGPDIIRHPGVGMIEFNAIAPSLLAKALELVVQKEARKSGRRRTPGPMVLKRLGEIGDIRNAVASLEFLCLKGDQEADWGAKVAFTKAKKGARDGIGLTRGEEDSLELISQREASLGIFHAVGKVVYNKRDEAPSGDPAEDLPSFLSEYSRPRKSQVSVDSLIDETGTDTHTFISALHENYVLSCQSSDAMDLSTPMDYVNDCIEALSESDLLCRSSDIFFGGRGWSGGRDSGSHILRQDEMAFQVAVRGMLFSLPNPVKRKAVNGAKGPDAFKMFYPASLKLWRAKEEIEGLANMWSTKLLKGETDALTKNLTAGAGAFRRPSNIGESSWVQRGTQNGRPSPSLKSFESQDEAQDSPGLLTLGSAAQSEMLLERLPYMAHIARGHKPSAIRLKDLEKVVSFRGLGGAMADEESEAEDETAGGETWTTDKPSEEASPKKKSTGIKAGSVTGLLAQKLVLSDDDIED